MWSSCEYYGKLDLQYVYKCQIWTTVRVILILEINTNILQVYKTSKCVWGWQHTKSHNNSSVVMKPKQNVIIVYLRMHIMI
jgi:hypothetical protein